MTKKWIEGPPRFLCNFMGLFGKISLEIFRECDYLSRYYRMLSETNREIWSHCLPGTGIPNPRLPHSDFSPLVCNDDRFGSSETLLFRGLYNICGRGPAQEFSVNDSIAGSMDKRQHAFVLMHRVEKSPIIRF